MAVDLLGQGQIKGHQDAGPDDGVETHDFLAHQMQVCRPVFIEHLLVVQEADGSQVIRQRIEPDIDDMLPAVLIRRHGHRHAPGEGGAGNAQILQTLLNEINHLIAAGFRLDKIRIFLDICQNAVCIIAHFEEIGLL